jgi:anti-sigma-K factor RskA
LNGHPQFDEEFDLYALGALDGEEKQALETHLRLCTVCGAKLHEANGRMALLALAAPPENVPSGIKHRLLRQVREETPSAHPTAVPSFLRWLTPALAVAALALLIVAAELKVENRALLQKQTELQAEASRLQQEAEREHSVLDLLTASDTLKVTLVSGSAHAVPEGSAFYHPHKGLLFYASNLPALPADRTYQLWLVPSAGNPISAGVFHVDPLGNGEVLLPKIPPDVSAKAFAVTVEPASGVPQPTGPKVLIGAVS